MKADQKTTTPLQSAFAEHVFSGKTAADAYRLASGRKVINYKDAANRGYRLMRKPPVQARLAELRSKSEVKSLLSYNDRLAILARDAQIKGKTPAHVNARARVIKVYSEITGDRAPDRHELTGPGGAPIPVAISGTIELARVPIRRKIELLKAARLRRRAEDEKASS